MYRIFSFVPNSYGLYVVEAQLFKTSEQAETHIQAHVATYEQGFHYLAWCKDYLDKSVLVNSWRPLIHKGGSVALGENEGGRIVFIVPQVVRT